MRVKRQAISKIITRTQKLEVLVMMLEALRAEVLHHGYDPWPAILHSFSDRIHYWRPCRWIVNDPVVSNGALWKTSESQLF